MTAPDVAVIGGGIVGVATAAYLARGGARVTLYEGTAIAAGASGRNSGVVQHPVDRELAALHRSTLAAYRELAHATDGAFRLPLEPAGLLYVSRDEAVVRAQAAAVAAAQPALAPEVVAGAALRALEPALASGVTACRLPIGYPVAPAAATRAFAGWARRLGVTVRLDGDVALARDGDGVAGVRVGGVLEPAGEVVVAAGPWSPGLLDPGGAWRPIRPLWGVVVSVGLANPPRHVLEQAGIATEPDDPREPAAATAAGAGVEFSLVTAGGASSVGSTFLDEEPEPSAWAAPILRAAARFVPAIEGAPVTGYRACARPLSRDGRPLVGRVPGLRNAWMAAGHGPWGISTGPASAAQIAAAILEGASIPAAFDPGRFGNA